VTIGEDFHSQVGDGKIRTTLYKVRWEGYDKKDDTWESITYLQGYVTMVKSCKESHVKDLEKLSADRQCQEAKTVTGDLVNTPKPTVWKKETQFLTSLMTSSVRKSSFTIGGSRPHG
jgi:hypothetical protein